MLCTLCQTLEAEGDHQKYEHKPSCLCHGKMEEGHDEPAEEDLAAENSSGWSCFPLWFYWMPSVLVFCEWMEGTWLQDACMEVRELPKTIYQSAGSMEIYLLPQKSSVGITFPPGL